MSGGSPSRSGLSWIDAELCRYDSAIRAEKNSSALRVFVCCSPVSVDATRGEVCPRLRGDLEHLGGRALGRELEDARAVRVEPHLGHERRSVALGRELQLEHEDRAEDRQVVEARAVRRVLLEEAPAGPSRTACAAASRPRRVRATSACPSLPFIDAGADVTARHRVDLDTEVRRAPELGRELARASPAAASRPSRRPCPARAAPGPRRPAWSSARSGVSKKKTWRIWASIGSRPSAAIVERCANRARSA